MPVHDLVVEPEILPPATAPEECVTAEELAELRMIRQSVVDGQQQIALLEERVVKAMGAFEHCAGQLQKRYALGAQDTIDTEGIIHRAAHDPAI